MIIIGPYQASDKGSKKIEGKADDWWKSRIMMEDGKFIFCLGFIREYFYLRESKTRLIL